MLVEALALLTDPSVPVSPTQAADAAGVLLKEGVLGALVILEAAFILYLVLRLNKVSDDRVADQKESAKAMIDLAKNSNEAVKDMTEAIEKAAGTTGDLKTIIARLDGTVESTLRDAVRWGYRRPTPPAVSSPEKG